MHVDIDFGELQANVDRIRGIRAVTAIQGGAAIGGVLTGAFSAAPGLQQLGLSHGAILNGAPGCATQVLQSLSEQVGWVGAALAATGSALQGQERMNQRAIARADQGASEGEAAVAFPARPGQRFTSFVFAPPAAPAGLGSMETLQAAFTATNLGAVAQAVATWEQLAGNIGGAAAELGQIAAGLAARNAGMAFDFAAGKIGEIAKAGATFAANAQIMAGSVAKLSEIHATGLTLVNQAVAEMSSIADPAARAAAEPAELAKFLAAFTPVLQLGVPPITNLMVEASGTLQAGGAVRVGIGGVRGPAWEASARPITGAAAGSWDAAGAGDRNPSGGEFAAASEHLEHLDAVGSHQAAAQPGAEGATGAPGTAGGHQAPALNGAGPAGQGAGPGSGPAAFAARSPQAAGIPGGAGGASAAPSRAGGYGSGGSTYPAAMAGVWRPAAGRGRSMSHGTAGRHALPTIDPAQLRTSQASLAGADGVQGGRGVSGRGYAGAFNAGPLSAPGAGGVARGSTSGPGAGTGTGSTGNIGGVAPVGTGQARAAAMRGGAPYGAMPVGTTQRTSRKGTRIKSVITKVEKDHNVAALIGDLGPVVPGPIGAWARG